MPTYLYQCTRCGAKGTAFRRIADRDDCPVCTACRSGAATARIFTAPLAVQAFKPYRTAAIDKEAGESLLIRSKAEHEAFLRRNGYEEVGNDKSMAPLPAEEIAERRQQKLRELAEDQAVVYDFNEITHEATA